MNRDRHPPPLGTRATRGRVLVVDDDPLIAFDLQFMLTDFGFSLCSVARSSDDALRVARSEAPDLVLMDLCLEGADDGVHAARRLRDELGLGVVYLTANSDLTAVERAATTQPYGYLLKPVRPLDLRCCLELALHQTKRERSSRADAGPRPAQDADEHARVEKLSARELEVLALIARGYTSKDIAQMLQIAKPTVDTYRSRLNEKLGARTRTQLVSIATRAGLLHEQLSSQPSLLNPLRR